ncbi:MAG: riboflavin kinase [Alistipes sp.]|nr:riboflavin kinase [Alistipes sp.]
MITIEGEVIHGQQLGRAIGFPTANMDASGVDIENGVYRSTVELDGSTYAAMTNVGVRPSVDGTTRLLETHIFGYEGSLYGRRLTVCLHAKLRDERKFPSLEALKEQIASDAAAILAGANDE